MQLPEVVRLDNLAALKTFGKLNETGLIFGVHKPDRIT
jgi:hypothetical protein